MTRAREEKMRAWRAECFSSRDTDYRIVLSAMKTLSLSPFLQGPKK
jgi:hypothetical protein